MDTKDIKCVTHTERNLSPYFTFLLQNNFQNMDTVLKM